ncbi:MAG: PaaI family thioesterase [Syntrophobacteraceae bacterium]
MDKNALKELPLRENHNCFGCSPTNVYGLRMKFFTDEKSLFSWVTVPRHLCGWDNLVHGGVLATILDETMGWTAIHFLKKLTLTKAMTVEFLKTVYVGEDLRAEGRVLEITSKREAVLEGYLYKGDNKLCVKSTGTFRLFTAESIVRLGIMEEKALRGFDYLIEPQPRK